MVVIGISASLVVAADAREGRNIDPTIVLLVKAIWIAYLTVSTLLPTNREIATIFIQLFVIMFTRLVFKFTMPENYLGLDVVLVLLRGTWLSFNSRWAVKAKMLLLL